MIAMQDTTRPLLALALSAALAFAGCVGTQGDGNLEANTAGGDMGVTLTAENAEDVSHLGFEVDRVLAHDANISLPDGYHDLDVQAGHADIVHDGEATSVELATGTLPAGTYDQILLRLDNATAETGSGGSHDHGDGADGHDHGGDSASTISTGSFDLPLNVTFTVTEDEPTEITFSLDVSESMEDDSFSPSFASAEVVQGEETVATETDLETRAGPNDASLPSDPPAPRISVFAPNGDKVLEPAFEPEAGTFANSVSSGFPAGEEAQFSATESEAVAKGAAIESYEWSLGDGTEATGTTTSHAYEEPGVYEVTLEVTDSYGNADEHSVYVVVVGWTQTVAETSFSESSEWTQQSGDAEINEWRLAGPGYQDDQAWHVGLTEEASDASEVTGAGYGPTNEAVSLLSPEYEIPEDFELVGYDLFVDGHASSGQLEILMHHNGTTDTLSVISDEAEWRATGGMDALEGVAGQTVQFEAVFTAAVDQPAEGPGYAIDAFTLAGMAEDDLVNSELLEQASGDGHDGHDHEH